jgi:hypothetical protein
VAAVVVELLILVLRIVLRLEMEAPEEGAVGLGLVILVLTQQAEMVG